MRGFTIIELLVTIVGVSILTILIVMLFTFANFILNSDSVAREAGQFIGEVKQGIEEGSGKNNRFERLDQDE